MSSGKPNDCSRRALQFWEDMGDLTSQALQGAPEIQGGPAEGVQGLAGQHPALNSWFGAWSFGILVAHPMVFNFDVYLPSGDHVHVVVQGGNVEDLIAVVERSFGRDGIRLLALPEVKTKSYLHWFLKELGEIDLSGYSKIRPKSSEFGIIGGT